MNSIKNIVRKDLMKKNKRIRMEQYPSDLFLLKEAIIKEFGVEKLKIYCASILNKLITKITNIHKSLTKH